MPVTQLYDQLLKWGHTQRMGDLESLLTHNQVAAVFAFLEAKLFPHERMVGAIKGAESFRCGLHGQVVMRAAPCLELRGMAI